MKKLSSYFLIALIFTSSLPFWALWIYVRIPLPNDFNIVEKNIYILAAQGELLGEITLYDSQQQKFIALNSLPEQVIAAVIATEDKNFFQHQGIDIPATARAALQNTTSGKIISGASTLSQQLARQYLKNSERNLENKLQEILWSLKIEHHLSKSEILELWLNQVSFGGNTEGIETAAHRYFGKSAQYLDLAESSFLAGIPQSPERFHPVKNFTQAKRRQAVVLQRMYEEGLISEEEQKQAASQNLVITLQQSQEIAPHFLHWIPHHIDISPDITPTNNLFPLQTTIDVSLQKNVQARISLHLKRLEHHNIHNAAALVWERHSGNILAFVGNADFTDNNHQGQVNILSSQRAVGSTLKPFLYVSAFEYLNWNPNTIIYDEPAGFETSRGWLYEPQNYDLQFRGPLPVRLALAESRNIPAVKTLEQVGIPTFMAVLQKFHIHSQVVTENDYGLSSALGSFDISPLELARAYGILARGGRDFEWQFLKSITNRYKSQSSEKSKIPSPSQNKLGRLTEERDIGISCHNIFSIIDILSDNTARTNAFGSKNPLTFPFAVAAKTGTTRNFRDNWTVGFSHDVGVLVWVGNANGASMRDVSGISGAAPLFAEIMQESMRGREKREKFVLEDICGEDEKRSIINNQQSARSKTTINEELQIMNNAELQNEDSLDSAPRILSPLSGQTFYISPEKPISSQKLLFEATEEVEWLVNGVSLGTGKKVFWKPFPGNIELETRNSEKRSKSISFTVRN